MTILYNVSSSTLNPAQVLSLTQTVKRTNQCTDSVKYTRVVLDYFTYCYNSSNKFVPFRVQVTNRRARLTVQSLVGQLLIVRPEFLPYQLILFVTTFSSCSIAKHMSIAHPHGWSWLKWSSADFVNGYSLLNTVSRVDELKNVRGWTLWLSTFLCKYCRV